MPLFCCGHCGQSIDADDARDLAAFNAAVARQNEIKEQGRRNTGKMFDDLRTVLPK